MSIPFCASLERAQRGSGSCSWKEAQMDLKRAHLPAAWHSCFCIHPNVQRELCTATGAKVFRLRGQEWPPAQIHPLEGAEGLAGSPGSTWGTGEAAPRGCHQLWVEDPHQRLGQDVAFPRAPGCRCSVRATRKLLLCIPSEASPSLAALVPWQGP